MELRNMNCVVPSVYIRTIIQIRVYSNCSFYLPFYIADYLPHKHLSIYPFPLTLFKYKYYLCSSHRQNSLRRAQRSIFKTFLQPVFMSNNLLPFFLISAFVALLDILPFIYKRCPWRYKAAVYFQVFATGMVVFCISPGLLPWWATGLGVGALLVLPRLILPPVRGAYAWYASLLNSLGMGLLFAFIRHSLTKIALLFV